MKKKVSNELKVLMEGRGNLCVSIIIPMHSNPTEQPLDIIAVEHAMQKARDLLYSKFQSSAEAYMKKIISAKKKIEFDKGSEGAGIFVSQDISILQLFPFPVKGKITAGASFEIRDVLYKEFFEKDYFVLSLSMKEAHLFKGKGNLLKEIQDEKFPALYKEEYEYNKPSRGHSYGNSLKLFEKDKSISRAIRIKAFYRKLDLELDSYLDGIPLVITGPVKDITHFEEQTKHSSNIKGAVAGNFDNNLTKELSERAWREMKSSRDKEKEKIIFYARELRGRGLVTIGVRDVWRDAKSGKGHILLIEKDYKRTAFLGKDEFRLLLRPPGKKDCIVIPDAVDDIIEMILEKNGDVVFTDNGRLQEFEHIALINRY